MQVDDEPMDGDEEEEEEEEDAPEQVNIWRIFAFKTLFRRKNVIFLSKFTSEHQKLQLV